MDDDWIAAGDIEKYGYCPLSWWLSLEEEEVVNDSLEQGIQDHEEMGDALTEVKKKEKLSKEMENLVLWLAVASTIVSIFGLILLSPEAFQQQIFQSASLIWLLAATFLLYLSDSNLIKDEIFKSERVAVVFAMVATLLTFFALRLRLTDENIARISQIISLMWLVGACYWLKTSLGLENEAKDKRLEFKMAEGNIDYVDEMDDESDLLVSNIFKIRGRPDYIIEKDGKYIPVEVKTGRVPKGPFFSHVLQCAAYCFLVEESFRSTPPHGIIQYGTREFKVDYDSELKKLLLTKVEEMKEILDNGEVHRNHNRPGKCANCSRREICKESLV
ncbi:MAG: CRISPR-associated protein Cas4 [Thermoplasmata archaeon]